MEYEHGVALIMGCGRMSASGEDASWGMIYKALVLDIVTIHETLLLES